MKQTSMELYDAMTVDETKGVVRSVTVAYSHILDRYDGPLDMRIRSALCNIHTLTACPGCGKGVRPRDMRRDRCIDCLAAMVETLVKAVGDDANGRMR